MKLFLRLRPSVSFVPIAPERGRYDFFLTNSRRTVSLVIEDERLVRFVLGLDGTRSYDRLAAEFFGRDARGLGRLEKFVQFLIDRCIVEERDTALRVRQHSFRRVLNFLADFIPYYELFDTWKKITETSVVIVGLGAMGSWVANLLARSGFGNFTLIDDDPVEYSNLNRSLFDTGDVGRLKIDVVRAQIQDILPDSHVTLHQARLTPELIEDVLSRTGSQESAVVINCADHPSVDYTSQVIGRCCMEAKVPHVIAGGYNLHLSLIGPTVLPYESACVECMRRTLDEYSPPELHRGLRRLDRPRRNIGSLAPLVAISASFVANEVIRVAARSPRIRPAMTSRRAEYNFFTNEIHYLDLPRRPDCPWCSPNKSVSPEV